MIKREEMNLLSLNVYIMVQINYQDSIDKPGDG